MKQPAFARPLRPVFAILSLETAVLAQELETFVPPPIKVAEGFEVSLAAAPPLVRYPMMACFDDRGRLYIAESDGRNLTTKAEIEKELPRFVRRLVDVDGDGVYDESTIFADKMTMPEGGLWHDGALYIISAPYLWRLEDTDDDGVADKREKILGYMEFDGRANQHGPYLGPSGRFYFTGGHFGYDLKGTDGSRSGVSRAAGVFSCWPDGSDVRVEGQGGINPVDVVFTENGEMLSTCAIFDSFGGRHDALIHWVHGGLTQRVYGVPLVPETGYRLPAMSRWGQVAPAGLVRYRGGQFGGDYKGTLFACQFNTGKLVHVRLKPHGATFATEELDFLSSSSIDFHPADVLEDADGSLLLLDTGGWLSWGCPHSKIAKPQIEGAIYRIRRTGGETVSDSRGLQNDWGEMKSPAVAAQLADRRPAVRDRATHILVARGEVAVASVIAAYEQAPTPEMRKRCLWVLSRIGSDPARATLRKALGDEDAGVRQVAARSLGTLQDRGAVPQLALRLNDSAAAVQRAAATALGQIGDASVVAGLFKLLKPETGLYLQHAATYALIEIGDSDATAVFLKETEQPHLQKAALRVLDQTRPSTLEASMVVPLLTSPNAVVRREAQRVISLRPQWRDEVLAVFSSLLGEPEPSAETEQLIEGIVLAFAKDETFHDAASRALADRGVSAVVKVRLLASIGFMDALPESFHDPIRAALSSPSKAIKGEALAVVQRFGMAGAMANAVQALARATDEAPEIRVAALEAIAKQHGELDAAAFAMLAKLLRDSETPALLGRQAAGAIGHIELSGANRAQADELCDLVAAASPLQIALLLQPFVNLSEPPEEGSPAWPTEQLDALGVQLAAALEKSPGRRSLEASRIVALRKAFPATLPAAHAGLHEFAEEGAQVAADREAKVESLLENLAAGNGSRGRVVFHTHRATCALCHRVGGEGGTLGPDLSKIGSIRSRRDLLEAIVFPSATVVNGYENYFVETADGETHAGLVQRETPEAVYLRNADQREQRVPREKIAKMLRAPVSAMPVGLDTLLTRQQLADIIAFLESCR